VTGVTDAPLNEGPTPLTTEGGAHEFTQLVDLCEALAGQLGDWSTDGADSASAATMASLSARLTEHAGWWRDQVPESVLLAEARDAASDPVRLTAVLAMLDVAPSARMAAVVPVLDGVVAHLVGLADRLSPVGDAPARRVLRLVLADLEDRPRHP
jgi:secreted protein with Ig-like and vWFA domain